MLRQSGRGVNEFFAWGAMARGMHTALLPRSRRIRPDASRWHLAPAARTVEARGAERNGGGRRSRPRPSRRSGADPEFDSGSALGNASRGAAVAPEVHPSPPEIGLRSRDRPRGGRRAGDPHHGNRRAGHLRGDPPEEHPVPIDTTRPRGLRGRTARRRRGGPGGRPRHPGRVGRRTDAPCRGRSARPLRVGRAPVAVGVSRASTHPGRARASASANRRLTAARTPPEGGSSRAARRG